MGFVHYHIVILHFVRNFSVLLDGQTQTWSV